MKDSFKKIRFHYAKKLLSPAGIYRKKHVKNGFQLQKRGYSIRNGFTSI